MKLVRVQTQPHQIRYQRRYHKGQLVLVGHRIGNCLHSPGRETGLLFDAAGNPLQYGYFDTHPIALDNTAATHRHLRQARLRRALYAYDRIRIRLVIAMFSLATCCVLASTFWTLPPWFPAVPATIIVYSLVDILIEQFRRRYRRRRLISPTS